MKKIRKMLKKRMLFGMTVILGMIFCTGCATEVKQEEATNVESSQEQEIPSCQKEIFAMDTYMTVTAYGEHANEAVEQAEKRIIQIDEQLSTGKENSEVALLNRNGKGVLSEDGAYLLECSLQLFTQTNGAFNPALYPVMCAWGFPDKNFRVPKSEELEELLLRTDASKIQYEKKTHEVTLEDGGMQLDFGGIAKGYTSAQIMKIFEENEIVSGMVSLGGNVQVYKTKTNGEPWRVAIQNPDGSDNYLGVLETKDRAVITSGGYERYFEEDGKIYHHIIDPSTGYPAENGLKSVTIVSSDGTKADGLSTALFVMGLDKGTEFYKKHAEEFDVIFYTDDNKLLLTEGISKQFYSEQNYEVIEAE